MAMKFRNLKVHCLARNSRPLKPNLIQISLAHTISYIQLLKIHFNVILSFTPWSPKGSFCSRHFN
jgi:hypothetical protein